MISNSVVIATGNRPSPLDECLASICAQSLVPDRVIVVDCSDNDSTERMLSKYSSGAPFKLSYCASVAHSAASQRNQGAEYADTELIFFLDDDVVLERDFIAEIVAVFSEDGRRSIAGVGGTVVNEKYAAPSPLNSFFLRLCIGPVQGSYAGRLVGPAVNFLPEDSDKAQPVEWLRSGCVAYRRQVFDRFKFSPSFRGYSFAEDVHLSARVARNFRLVSTGRARLHHKSLGGKSHKDWVALGEMIICNRYEIMTHVLNRNDFGSYVRLVAFELGYGPLASLWNGGRIGSVKRIASMSLGKIRGLLKIVRGITPHDLSRSELSVE